MPALWLPLAMGTPNARAAWFQVKLLIQLEITLVERERCVRLARQLPIEGAQHCFHPGALRQSFGADVVSASACSTPPMRPSSAS